MVGRRAKISSTSLSSSSSLLEQQSLPLTLSQIQNEQNKNILYKNPREIEADIKDNLQLVYNKHPNSVVSKQIQELLSNFTQKNIVVLLTEIAQKPEVCVDFNVPLTSLLDMYLACGEDPVLSEAGYLIFSSSQIYSRKVDSIYESFERIGTGIQEDLKEIQEAKNNKTNDKPKRGPKRKLQLNDHLYEAELVPKKFKSSVNNKKITEKITNVCLLDPPTHYFKNWKRYKEWRLQQMKRMKSNTNCIPYSTVADNQFIHSSIWKDSCIEDFDCDDDLDTKRGYRMFTNLIEHRYNMLVNDINFSMHFKVRDYIEAEEDKIEEMNNLGLPSPPKRKWPPFCKSNFNCNNRGDYGDDYVDDDDTDEEDFNVNNRNNYGDNENNDYLKNYVELEDAVLQHENILDKDNYHKAKRKIEFPKPNDTNGFMECNFDDFNDETDVTTLNDDNELDATENRNLTITQSRSLSSTIATNANDDSENNDDSGLNSAESTQVTTVNGSIVSSLEENKSETDKSKILVHLSLDGNDEGVYFEDLDIVDHAMISPVVELVDILKPMASHNEENILFQFNDINTVKNGIKQKKLVQNKFGIPDIYLNYNEEFSLPSEYFKYKKLDLKLNILKLPETQVRRPKIFSLPPEYDLLKKDRCKRACKESTERKYRLYKLNDQDMTNVPITPPSSPTRQIEGFFGFDEVEVNELNKASDSFNKILYSTNTSLSPSSLSSSSFLNSCNTKQSRNNSRDSGIGFLQNSSENTLNFNSTTNDALLLNNNENNNDSNNSNCNDNNVQIRNESSLFCDSGIQSENSNLLHLSNGNNSLQDDSCRNSQDELEEDLVTNLQNELEEDLVTNLQDELEEDLVTSEKVENWHRRLKPVLAKAKERHHFDIFGIGTEIIETFPQQNTENHDNSTITLEKVMEGKDPSFRSRYFLSTLLLANQGNIDIFVENQSEDKPTPLSNINLKLLSSKRHMVSAEDNIGLITNERSRKRPHSPVSSTSVPAKRLTTSSTTTSESLNSNFSHNSSSSLSPKNSTLSSSSSLYQNGFNENNSTTLTQKRHKVKTSSNIHNTKTATTTATTSLLLSTPTIVASLSSTTLNDSVINYADVNDGFAYPKKPKNFLNLTNKSFHERNDETDSGFHSQMSSNSRSSSSYIFE